MAAFKPQPKRGGGGERGTTVWTNLGELVSALGCLTAAVHSTPRHTRDMNQLIQIRACQMESIRLHNSPGQALLQVSGSVNAQS